MNRYAKAILAVVATVLVALVPYFSHSNHLTDAEWINVVILGLGAIVVYVAPNLPGAGAAYTKSIVAALIAGATLLVSAVGAGSFSNVTGSEWVQIALAALAAVGVYAVPNATAALTTARSAPPAV